MLGDKFQWGLRTSIRLTSFQFFAFIRVAHYKQILTKGKERHKDKTLPVPFSSLTQKQNPPPLMPLSHWGKVKKKSTSWL